MEDDRFYCLRVYVPPNYNMERTVFLAAQEIMTCGHTTTFTKHFKKCINDSNYGRMHFDSIMLVYESQGDCDSQSAGLEESHISTEVDYNYNDRTSAVTPYGETFITPTDETKITVSPKKESGTLQGLQDKTEFAIGFTGKSEFSQNPTTDKEASLKPTWKVFVSSTRNGFTVSTDLIKDTTDAIDDITSNYNSDFLNSSAVHLATCPWFICMQVYNAMHYIIL